MIKSFDIHSGRLISPISLGNSFPWKHGRDLTSSHRDLSLLKSSLNLCKHQGVARRKMTRTSRLSIYKSFSTVRQRFPIPNIPYILNISPFYSHYSWAVLNWRSNVVPRGLWTTISLRGTFTTQSLPKPCQRRSTLDETKPCLPFFHRIGLIISVSNNSSLII